MSVNAQLFQIVNRCPCQIIRRFIIFRVRIGITNRVTITAVCGNDLLLIQFKWLYVPFSIQIQQTLVFKSSKNCKFENIKQGYFLVPFTSPLSVVIHLQRHLIQQVYFMALPQTTFGSHDCRILLTKYCLFVGLTQKLCYGIVFAKVVCSR